MPDVYHDQVIQGRHVETSVDLVRRDGIATTTLTGLKRPHDTDNVHAESNNSFPEVRTIFKSARQLNTSRQCLRASSITCLLPQSEKQNQESTRIPTYSQRTRCRSTPGPSQNPLLSLRHPRYTIPEQLISNLESLGVHSIYPWQSSCLVGKGILAGETNFVYTAPTGGGKSLVAEILLLKKILENPKKKAVLVLPYVALVQEKVKWLRRVVEGLVKYQDCLTEEHARPSTQPGWKTRPSHIRLAGFFGGSKARSTWADIDIAVCTIEKANSLINTATEEGRIDELGILVVDELHMIDEEHRGYIVELMMTKVLALEQGTQIIGMSATLSNPKVIAEWMGAKFYISGYRPIPIDEYLVYQNLIYSTTNVKQFHHHLSTDLEPQDGLRYPPEACRRIATSTHGEFKDPVANAVVALTIETVLSGYGALVFCSSRQGTQNMASLIAEAIPTESLPDNVRDRRKDLVASLQSLPDGFEPALAQTIVRGVAFHHAGLTSEERELVAEAYDQGVLGAMVATCSLAAGINLPARRVILNGARMGRDLVGPAMLRQMRGRAGRKGKDEIGETFLCCQTEDLEAVVGLLEAEMPAVQSCLTPEKRGIKRALLEVIGTQLATSRQSLDEYVRKSLSFCTADDIPSVWSMVEDAIQELLTTGLIQSTGFDSFEPSRIGKAVVASSLTPEEGLFVHDELRQALECFVMDGEMHIFYLFTPVRTDSLSTVSWRIFRDQLEALDESGMRALRCIGISPALVNSLANSGSALKENTAEEVNRARKYRRVFAAFQLRDLCNEMEIDNVSARYSVPRGKVQSLAQSCHGFAAGMIKFSERMGWGMLAAVLEHMVDRLRAGARADLLEMAQVTHVKSRMARMLWENGFKSVRALAEAEAADIVPVMMLAQSKKLAKQEDEGREKLMLALEQKAEMIVGSANRIWERQQLVDLED